METIIWTTTCNGKISNNGYCDKCGIKSETSSCYCTRLIEHKNKQ